MDFSAFTALITDPASVVATLVQFFFGGLIAGAVALVLAAAVGR